MVNISKTAAGAASNFSGIGGGHLVLGQAPFISSRKKDGDLRICGDYRCLDAVSMPDSYPTPYIHVFSSISAQTAAKVFYDTWISRYGAPEILTTDQGSQFKPRLFSALLALAGCERMRTTAYHPIANGLVYVKILIMCLLDIA